MSHAGGAFPKIPEVICQATNGAGGGIVSSSADNQTGTQADAPLIVGTSYTKWFEVKGRYATLLLNFVKGGATDLKLGFVIFGSDAVVQKDNDIVIGSDGTVSAIATTNRIKGRSYILLESSMGNVAWQTQVFTADSVVAIPVHFGVSNRATPATIPVSSEAACFPGRYARLSLTITGANITTTGVGVEIAWGD